MTHQGANRTVGTHAGCDEEANCTTRHGDERKKALPSCGYYKFVPVKIEQNIMQAGFNLSFPFDGNILNVVLWHTKQSNNADLEQLHVKYC